MVGILKAHEKEVLKEAKNVSNAKPLAFVAKPESSKSKACKLIKDDSDSGSTNEEFINKIKAIMISNPKIFFKKNFSKIQRKQVQWR